MPRLGSLEAAVDSVQAKIAGVASESRSASAAVTQGIDEIRALFTGNAVASSTDQANQGTAAASTAQALARRVKPSVVDITALLSSSAWEQTEALGTGVILSSDGLIVTNNHVITGDGTGVARSIEVTLVSGAHLTARVVGRDPAHDLAILRIAAHGLQAAHFDATSAALAPGRFVVAIGNDHALSRPVTSGHIIGLLPGTELEGDGPLASEVVETSVPLAQGDSGGPSVDTAGSVIGVDTAELVGEKAGLDIPGQRRASGCAHADRTVAVPRGTQQQSPRGTGLRKSRRVGEYGFLECRSWRRRG